MASAQTELTTGQRANLRLQLSRWYDRNPQSGEYYVSDQQLPILKQQLGAHFNAQQLGKGFQLAPANPSEQPWDVSTLNDVVVEIQGPGTEFNSKGKHIATARANFDTRELNVFRFDAAETLLRYPAIKSVFPTIDQIASKVLTASDVQALTSEVNVDIDEVAEYLLLGRAGSPTPSAIDSEALAALQSALADRARFVQGLGGPEMTQFANEIRSLALALDTKYRLGGSGTSSVQSTKLTPPTQPLATAVQQLPPSLQGIYALALSDDSASLSINPRRSNQPATRSITVSDNAQGGKDVGLGADGPFKNGQWIKASLKEVVSDPGQLDTLTLNSYDLSSKRDLLVVTGQSNEPIVIALSKDSNRPGFVAICTEISFVDINGQPGQVFLRKPVVYFYPEQVTNLTVQVRLAGSFSTQYPKSKDGVWNLKGGPDGVLFDPVTERRYSYIFWEGVNSEGFEIDPARSHVVTSTEAQSFLEHVATRFAFNDRERTDFVTYWLPSLERNERSLVQFLDDATYDRYASMTVSPTPNTVIRLFMIFQRLNREIVAGNPDLPARIRKGFTVVEWGGCDLDEMPQRSR